MQDLEKLNEKEKQVCTVVLSLSLLLTDVTISHGKGLLAN